jgi:hypothetical protein
MLKVDELELGIYGPTRFAGAGRTEYLRHFYHLPSISASKLA